VRPHVSSSGAEALIFGALAARLKPCPSRSCCSPESPARMEAWNPMSRKGRETWGTRSRGDGGGQQVPRRAFARFGMTSGF
jgi:hypothetical protein